jgi:class 3 adenylate cyclase
MQQSTLNPREYCEARGIPLKTFGTGERSSKPSRSQHPSAIGGQRWRDDHWRGEGMAVGTARTAERNIITVLAVDMVSSTRHIAACDPDEAQAFLDQLLDHIRSSVERLGGRLFTMRDGGIAIFGWPTAYEDHADRACIAAWDIQSHSQSTGPEGDPVNFRVGVHSGLVGLRKGGRNAIARFDVAGATVHVAAKLEQEAAPGEVRVSAETAKLCRSPLYLTDAEADRLCGAGRYERTQGQQDTRAGSYERSLHTVAGDVNLKVPNRPGRSSATCGQARWPKQPTSSSRPSTKP